MSKKLIVLVFSLIILSALFIKVRASLSVVRADGENLSWQDFSVHRSGLVRFRDLNKENVSDGDIERGVLLSFIEDALVKKELERRGKNKEDVKNEISRNIDENALNSIEDATIQLYAWSLEDFKKFILYPQARRSILANILLSEGMDMDTWLEKSLSEANISIYLFSWKWSDGDVKERF